MIKNLSKFCLWSLAFVPLIIDENVFYPETSGKNLLIESCLVLCGILLLINYFYSRKYRDEIISNVIKHIKHPLVISVLAYILILIMGTIFAVDKYAAFWGDLSRAEGLTGLLFFFAFFAFSLLIFEKKDWSSFFKLSLLASLILLGKEFIEFFHDGVSRPGSFTGNPTFLAGYLLFSIASALIVIGETKAKFWKFFSVLIIILSIAGIFLAQTRGTILGLGVGLVAVLIYCAVKGKSLNYRIFNLRKTAVVILCLGIIFSGIFVVTRKNEIWQKVPGLSRLAVTNTASAEDISTPVRLYLYQTALESVNPVKNGWKKFFLGWGPENYIIASSKYYNPAHYKYETSWYDRSHNKLLDALVMNGLIGLLVYLSIWVFLFRYILKQKESFLTGIGVLVFASSYLAHLMFVFDQISTSVPFFAIVAFTVYLTSQNSPEESKTPEIGKKMREKREILTGTFLVVLTAFLMFGYFKNTIPGYIEMRDYTSLINSFDSTTLEREINSVFSPFTVAQMNIRQNFLLLANSLYNKDPNETNLALLEKAIKSSEEYIATRPSDFRFMTAFADLYTKRGNLLDNIGYLRRGETLLRNILTFAPNRPDVNFGLAINLFYQQKYTESFSSFEKSFALYPDYFASDYKKVEGYYASFVRHFYEQKNKTSFILAADRLKLNNYPGSSSLDKILDYIDKTGRWPAVNFE